MEPNQKRAAAKHWFERSAGPACSAEVIFFTLLVLKYAPLKAGELHDWAKGVLDAHEEQYLQQGAAWTMPAEWKPNRGSDCATMKVLVDAYLAEPKTNDALDAIGTAMQAWRGIGRDDRFDNLTSVHLKQHFAWTKEGKVAKAGIAKARLRAAIIPVAGLVKRHGPELRRLLHIEPEERPDVPTMMQENETLKRRAADAEEAAAAEKKRRLTSDNKVSQYGLRLKSKQKAVSDARKAWNNKTAAKKKKTEAVKRRKQMKEWEAGGEPHPAAGAGDGGGFGKRRRL